VHNVKSREKVLSARKKAVSGQQTAEKKREKTLVGTAQPAKCGKEKTGTVRRDGN
jgi:hypothetical protein